MPLDIEYDLNKAEDKKEFMQLLKNQFHDFTEGCSGVDNQRLLNFMESLQKEQHEQ